MRFLLFLFLSAPAGSALAAPELLDGVDIAPTVELARASLQRLTRPVHVYNWSKQHRIADAPDARAKVAAWARGYWKTFGAPYEVFSTFGLGLYVAVDPVASSQHGLSARSRNWLLAELVLPADFVFLDVTKVSEVPEAVRAVNRAFECQETAWVEQYFFLGGSELREPCRRLVRRVFAELLAIDGLYYSYQARPFSACDRKDQSRAFVLWNDRWMNAATVRVMNERTTDFREERRRIQTLFLLKDAPGEPISSAAARNTRQRRLLWKDLEGASPSEGIDAWLQENKFNCARRVGYSEPLVGN